MTKKLTLSELQAMDLPCVFCRASSKKVSGGYFKQQFLCGACNNELLVIESYLRREKIGGVSE